MVSLSSLSFSMVLPKKELLSFLGSKSTHSGSASSSSSSKAPSGTFLSGPPRHYG